MNMKKLITLTAMATTMLAIGAGTFESIPFNQATYSEDDPLGVQAIQNAETGLTTLVGAVTTVSNNVNDLEAAIPNKVKAILTNDTVVVGSAKEAGGAGMESTPNAIVFAVNRDMDEMQADNGQILFAADGVKFNVGLNAFWIGDDNLTTILGNAGQGEVNAIIGIQTNGQDVVIDGNRKVNITIPAPGEENVITSITTNGVALPINNKTVDIPLGDYVKMSDLQEGITFNTMNVTNLTINGKNPALEGHKHVGSDIEGFDGKLDAKNGNALGILTIGPDPEDPNFVIGLGKVYIDHESVKITNTTQAPDTIYRGDGIVLGNESYLFDNTSSNGIARIKDISSYKNPTISAAAAQAITDINNANDIATIKSTLTNFLQNFVIQNP